MPSHGRLLAVIGWHCWGEPLGYELAGVNEDRLYPAFCQIGFIFGIETEARAKGRLRKARKERLKIVHVANIGWVGR